MLAAEKGHEAVVKLLLVKNGVDLSIKDEDSQTPLSRAVENGLKTVIQLLLAKDGVDLDSKDEYGQTPLSCYAFAQPWSYQGTRSLASRNLYDGKQR